MDESYAVTVREVTCIILLLKIAETVNVKDLISF